MSRKSASVYDSEQRTKFIMLADQALPVEIFAPAWRQPNQILKDISSGYATFVVHPGDLGYAMSSQYLWDLWGHLVRKRKNMLNMPIHLISITIASCEFEKGFSDYLLCGVHGDCREPRARRRGIHLLSRVGQLRER